MGKQSMKVYETMEYPIIVELAGRSGVGKSFIYKQLKKELEYNSNFLFVDTSELYFSQLINLKIFFNSLLKIACCSLKLKVFYKYFKKWYLKQLLMHNYRNRKVASFVIIDEGPFQLVKSFMKFRKRSSDHLKRCVFNQSTKLPDIVIIVDADRETIYIRRQTRKNHPNNKFYKNMKNKPKKDNSLIRIKENIKFAGKYKNIHVIEIKNTDHDLESNIEFIVKELTRIKFCVEEKNLSN